jgi:hypothetical protein
LAKLLGNNKLGGATPALSTSCHAEIRRRTRRQHATVAGNMPRFLRGCFSAKKIKIWLDLS